MNEKHLFIRFSGRLWEDMHFEREPGWETERIAERPEDGKGDYLLELRDDEGRMLVAVSPDVDFDRQSTSPQVGMRVARIIAYLPLNPLGREIVFRRGEMVIERDQVAKDPPEISITEFESDQKNRIHLAWQAVHPEGRKLTYNIIYVVNDKRAFTLARRLKKNKYVADLSHLPGSRAARLAVLATDGVRSGFVVSKSFAVAEKPAQISIQKPVEGETLPADQPISLCGQATDVAGASLPQDGLTWSVDNKIVARGSTLALATGTEPGTHKITLQYKSGKRTKVEKTITIKVAKRSAEQEQFNKLMRE